MYPGDAVKLRTSFLHPGRIGDPGGSAGGGVVQPRLCSAMSVSPRAARHLTSLEASPVFVVSPRSHNRRCSGRRRSTLRRTRLCRARASIHDLPIQGRGRLDRPGSTVPPRSWTCTSPTSSPRSGRLRERQASELGVAPSPAWMESMSRRCPRSGTHRRRRWRRTARNP